MSKEINRIIAELIADDVKDIKKLNKSELFKLTVQLLENNYRELHNDTIVELYQDNFNSVIR